MIILALCLCIAPVLTGCGNDAADTSQTSGDAADTAASAGGNSDITIGINVKTLSNSYFREIAYGAIEHAEDLGINYILTSSDSNNDLAGQIATCEDMLASGIDALLITPQNSTGIATLVEECNAKNVPVIVIDTKAEDCVVATTLMLDEHRQAMELAEMTAKKMGGSGKLIVLAGVAGTSSSDNKEGAIKAHIAENYPNIELVAQNANYSQEMGQEVMADLIQANDDIKAVIALNDMMMMGAIVSLEEAGYTCNGDTGVICSAMSISTTTAQYIKEGKVWVSSYSSPQDTGYSATGFAMMAMNGQKLAPIWYQPHVPYNAENIDELLPDLETVEAYNFNN